MIKLTEILTEIEYPLASKKDLTSYMGMEGWKGKLVYMTPDKFLRLASPIPENQIDKETIKRLEGRMKNQLPIDFCVLEVDMKTKRVTGHEGRHRCITAKKLGIEKVPVLIYTGSCFDRVPNWDKNTHDIIDKSDFLPQINEDCVDIVGKFENQLQNKYRKFLEELMFYYDAFSKGIFLSDIYIKREFRGLGYGGKVMKELIDFADKNHMPISLIPVSDDAPRHKLVNFYKQLGFIENAGNTLFDNISMYRLPKS